jgi:predicted nuclease of predicted toxin-antitoxin system
MKFKTDENLPTEAADLLRAAGHDAVTVGEQRLGGSVDATVGSVCQREGRVLVTLDLDFADIQTYPPDRYPGFVVLRLVRQDKARVLRVIARTIPLLMSEAVAGRLWIVEDHQVRIHGE